MKTSVRYKDVLSGILFYISFLILATLFGTHCLSNDYVPVSGHPRLLLKNGEEEQIKALIADSGGISDVNEAIIRYCDGILSRPAVREKNVGKRRVSAGDFCSRVFNLCYAYRITKEKVYADKAIEEIINICNFPDWNPDHFLDVAMALKGVSLGYDWLYDLLEDDEKALIVNAVKEKAFLPSFDPKHSRVFYWYNNWNSVCNSAFVYGAVAFNEELHDLAVRALDRCMQSNPRIMAAYSPDGGYPEGYGYWSYGTTNQILLLDALNTAFNTDYGLLEKFKAFLSTGKYYQFMKTPLGGGFNFGDSEYESKLNVAMWWFAAKNSDLSLLHTEIGKVNDYHDYLLGSSNLTLLPIFASRIKDGEILQPSGKCWFSKGKTPVFAYRSGWDNPKDTYLGVKGGSASTTHAHMDAGSFIYERDSVRWAMDLGLQNYNSLESKGVNISDYSQNGQRWEVLRMRNDHHNTLTVDNSNHIAKANAAIIDTFTNEKKGAVVDLTATLGKVKKSHREVSLDRNDNLTVTDSIETLGNPVEITWTIVTPASAKKISDNSILLSKDGKSMEIKFESSLPVSLYIKQNTPLHPYDAPNKGTIRVGCTLAIPADTQTVLKVNLAPSVEKPNDNSSKP